MTSLIFSCIFGISRGAEAGVRWEVWRVYRGTSYTYQPNVQRDHHLWHPYETLPNEIHTFMCLVLTFNNRPDNGTVYLNALSREPVSKNCPIPTQLQNFQHPFNSLIRSDWNSLFWPRHFWI